MEYNKIPLVFNNSINTSNIKKIILIDSSVNEAEIFYNSVNSNTYPIIYSYYSDKTELEKLLETNFTNIETLGIVMHNGTFPYKKFINNEYFFTDSDLESNSVTKSNNFNFIIELIKKFNIHNLDILACKSLLEPKWVKYYDLIHQETGVKIGASDDDTGNIKYGGDWILESTGEDVQNIYWNENILNYSSKLDITTLSQAGGIIYLKQSTTSSYIDYSTDNTTWTSLGANWPIHLLNTTTSDPPNILRVEFKTDMILNNDTIGNLANCYFVIKSQYITIEGNNYTLTINQAPTNGTKYTSFPGLVLNGGAEGFSDITVQNIAVLTDPAPNSATAITLPGTSGWICQANFAQVNGVERTNCFVNSCYSNGNIDASGGGIVGGGSSGTVYNCYSTGSMMNYAGGIFGTYSYNNARAIKCYSTGTMGRASGGIFGGGCHGSAEYCYSTGNIGLDAGGIFGSESGNDHNSYKGAAVAINCYSTGLIGTQGGGIYGARSNVFAINCYSRGNINTGAGGIAGWQSSGTTINCYSIGDIELAGGGIFGMDSGIIKIKNCYTSGKLKYSIDISEKYKGGLIGWVDNTFFINNYNSTTVENSFAENSTFYDVNNLTSTNNNGWSDANAQTYLLANLVGSEWISNTPNTPYTFSTPANSRTLSNFSHTSSVPFNGQPVIPSTLPVSSTGTGTIKYFSSNPYVATVNNSTGTFTTTGSGDTKLIAILSAENGYRTYSKYFTLTVNNAILKNGNTNAPEGYYYITNSDNLAIQNKIIFVNSSGFIKIIYDNKVWCSNSKKIYIDNFELNLGQNVGSIILASNGVKYSLDGNTWN